MIKTGKYLFILNPQRPINKHPTGVLSSIIGRLAKSMRSAEQDFEMPGVMNLN